MAARPIGTVKVTDTVIEVRDGYHRVAYGLRRDCSHGPTWDIAHALATDLKATLEAAGRERADRAVAHPYEAELAGIRLDLQRIAKALEPAVELRAVKAEHEKDVLKEEELGEAGGDAS